MTAKKRMTKEDVDKMIKKIHDLTVEYANKHPNQIDLSKMEEVDEQLKQKIYAKLGLSTKETKPTNKGVN